MVFFPAKTVSILYFAHNEKGLPSTNDKNTAQIQTLISHLVPIAAAV